MGRFLIKEDKYFWFIMYWIIWKIHVKVNQFVISKDHPLDFESDEFWVWIILISKEASPNDLKMDAAKKLILRAQRVDPYYQSILNFQKKSKLLFCPFTQEHTKLLHSGCYHWFLSFCWNTRLQICDNLNVSLTRESPRSVQAHYKKIVEDNKDDYCFLRLHKQPDTYNYGFLAIAFAAEVLDDKSPINAVFDVQKTRTYLIQCLEGWFHFLRREFKFWLLRSSFLWGSIYINTR